MFHMLKKTVASTIGSGEKTVDPAYDTAKENFMKYNGQLHQLKAAITNYQTSLKTLFFASKHVAESFADALDDAPKPHPYQSMVLAARRTRTELVSERAEGAVSHTLQTTSERRLNEELEKHTDLLKRMTERESMKTESEYYVKKTAELTADREKRAAKGKPESPADVEKFDRNKNKATDLAAAYTAHNQSLINELTDRWNDRVNVLGPAMSDFILVEKQVLTVYGSAVRDGAPEEDQIQASVRQVQSHVQQAAASASEQFAAAAAGARSSISGHSSEGSPSPSPPVPVRSPASSSNSNGPAPPPAPPAHRPSPQHNGSVSGERAEGAPPQPSAASNPFGDVE